MTKPPQTGKSPKKQQIRFVIILIIMGLAVHLLIPQITTLEKSWAVIKSMSWWAVLLAGAAQGLSYLGAGFMLREILSSNQKKLSVIEGALITMGSGSVGLVAGGWVGGAAATYRWVRKESKDNNTAALSGTLPSLLNNSVLVVIALFGTVYLLIVHDLSKTQLIEFVTILIILGGLLSSGLIALRSPEKTTKLAVWLSRKWAAFRRKPFSPENTVESVNKFIIAWQSLRQGRWIFPLLGAIANIGFDILTLFFVFLATGYPVSPEVLFAGYGLPLILGKMAFLFPGGVGVIEGSMVALYTSLQIPNGTCVVVILGYRLLSFWIPTILGFLAAAYLSKK